MAALAALVSIESSLAFSPSYMGRTSTLLPSLRCRSSPMPFLATTMSASLPRREAVAAVAGLLLFPLAPPLPANADSTGKFTSKRIGASHPLHLSVPLFADQTVGRGILPPAFCPGTWTGARNGRAWHRLPYGDHGHHSHVLLFSCSVCMHKSMRVCACVLSIPLVEAISAALGCFTQYPPFPNSSPFPSPSHPPPHPL